MHEHHHRRALDALAGREDVEHVRGVAVVVIGEVAVDVDPPAVARDGENRSATTAASRDVARSLVMTTPLEPARARATTRPRPRGGGEQDDVGDDGRDRERRCDVAEGARWPADGADDGGGDEREGEQLAGELAAHEPDHEGERGQRRAADRHECHEREAEETEEHDRRGDAHRTSLSERPDRT